MKLDTTNVSDGGPQGRTNGGSLRFLFVTIFRVFTSTVCLRDFANV